MVRTGNSATGTDLLAGLREAPLRAIYRLERPEGPLLDVNPYTPALSAYALASMLTLNQDGSPVEVRDLILLLSHMVDAGNPERVRAQRDWTVWELTRMGAQAEARRLSELVWNRRSLAAPAAGA